MGDDGAGPARRAAVVRLRPMTAAEYEVWERAAFADYIAQRVGAGEFPDVAAERARSSHSELLPEGLASAGMHLLAVEAVGDPGRVPVGWLWLCENRPEDGCAWVYSIDIDASRRAEGLGRAAMLAAEDWLRARGVSALGLNVFGHNTVARRLYDSLDYQVTSQQMRKSL